MKPHRVSEIWREHREAGALNGLIPACAFVDESTFLTKGGELGVVLCVRGVDYECLDSHDLDNVSRRFEACLRCLGENYRLYQYLIKRSEPRIVFRNYQGSPVVERAIQDRIRFLHEKATNLYSLEVYFVLLYSGWSEQRGASFLAELKRDPRGALSRRLSAARNLAILESDLKRGIESLRVKACSLLVQLEDFLGAELLQKNDAYRFLIRLLNYESCRIENAALEGDFGLDRQLAQSALECHRDHLRLQDHFLKVFSATVPPAQTFAHLLQRLWELPSNAIVVSEWKRVGNAEIRKLIRSKRRHFHNSKTSLANYVNSTPTSDRSLLIDDADEAMVADLGLCLRELEVNGSYFGEWSMTVILYDLDRSKLDRAGAECVKVFATHDATVIEERYNLLNAWLAALPGNHHYNLRRSYLLNTNCADLSFLFTLHSGELLNPHLGKEYLAVLETNHHTPYYLNLHYQDNAHTAILGATGSGKSFALNFLITNLQKYQPYTVIFDLGGGYENLTRLFQGSYWKLGVDRSSFLINPFVLEPTKENLHFIYSFVRVLVESSGLELSSAEERDLFAQIENLYQVERSMRRLFTLRNIVSRRVSEHLDKWVGDGPYARLFDNVEDNLTFTNFQCFDFEGMDKYPQILEPLLFYILHRANASIYAPELTSQLKVFVMDEAWRFFRNPTIKNYIVEALKTWRKKNAAMILATQSADDLISSELLPVIVESCATKMFLANPGMDRAAYRERFHLNETEAELVARLVPKQQILIKRPDLAKVVNLYVDRSEYWLYTSNPHDHERRRKAFEQHGFEQGLEILTRGNVA